jgi:hypothetical protein
LKGTFAQVTREFPLPPGEGGAAAPGEGSPPHDLKKSAKSWGGLPSSGAAAPPSPGGRRTVFQFGQQCLRGGAKDPLLFRFIFRASSLRLYAKVSFSRRGGCGIN